ncbi:ArnT family glycosyltransferase [Bacteroidota bacterium]
MGDEFSINLTSQLKFLKKNWQWIILVIILIAGTHFRLYHVDYPVNGYHNWKETHYLTEARNFANDGFFKHGFFIPAWDYPNYLDPPSGVHGDTFPTTSILIGLLFKIFGSKLIVARLFNVFVAVASILIFYLVLKKGFKRDDVALTGAALLAINPLHIFFGRNTQLINIALLFMLISVYFYFEWMSKKNYTKLILAVTFFMLSFITKTSFFVIAIPILLTFPYKKELKDFKKNIKPLAIAAVIVLVLGFYLIYSYMIVPPDDETTKTFTLNLIQFDILFSKSFWTTQKFYIIDNFTMLGFILGLAGLGLLSLKSKKNLGEKFFFYYFIGSIVWFVIMAYKLSGHNYHYYPILPLIMFGITYLTVFISVNISNLVNFKFARPIIQPVIIIVVLLILFSPSVESRDRMFDTQFWGLDIAGEYINAHKLPGERVIHSSHQAYGLLWHADMKGSAGINDLTGIEFMENNLNATWLFMYNWDFARVTQDRESWTHIANNYRIVQTAFSVNNNQLTGLYYFLFRKGGSFNKSLFSPDGNLNVELFSSLVNGKPIQNWYYERTIDKPIIQYVNLE